MSSKVELDDLLGNIHSDRRPVLQPEEVVIDQNVADEVARQREKFESNDSEKDKVNLTNTLTSPSFIRRFRRELGATTADDTLLFRFMSDTQTRDIFSDLRDQELGASGRILNAISRCGVQNVGDLRSANIALLFSRKDRIAYLNGLTIGNAVAAQMAFKPFDTLDTRAHHKK